MAIYVLVEEGGDGFNGVAEDSVFLGDGRIGGRIGSGLCLIDIGEGIRCCCCIGGGVEVSICVVPVIDRVVHVSFEVGHGATVGTHELWVCFVVVEHGADTFEVPDVGARGDEERLTGL